MRAGGSSYTIGYQMAPLYCIQCRSTGPCAARSSRSLVRQSFWFTSRPVPSLITNAESPPGPSVMLISQWMAMVRFGPELHLLAVDRAHDVVETRAGA